MFKYLKTVGAHSGAPEIERMPAEASAVIPKFCLCEMDNGYLSHTYTEKKHKFLILEEKKENDGKTHIDCIRLLPGMILECDFIGNTDSIKIGSLINASCEESLCYDHCEDGSGNIEVVDTADLEKRYKLSVTIHY